MTKEEYVKIMNVRIEENERQAEAKDQVAADDKPGTEDEGEMYEPYGTEKLQSYHEAAKKLTLDDFRTILTALDITNEIDDISKLLEDRYDVNIEPLRIAWRTKVNHIEKVLHEGWPDQWLDM